MSSSVLNICETFTSLQGEGLDVGLPCFFIRFSGCNLHCSYCDTGYARHAGTKMTTEELCGLWRESGVPLVQITGGEPLIQTGVYGLMEALLSGGARVLLETNGSVPLDRVSWQVVKVVDIKTPGSGMAGSWRQSNLKWLASYDQVKFVITSREDYEWACEMVRRYNLSMFINVLFSPAWGMISPRQLASWVVEDRLNVRFQLQIHKVLWGEKTGC